MTKPVRSLPTRQRKALKQGFLVYKQSEHYAVLRQADHRFDYLSLLEGFSYRLGFGLPKRILTWSAPDGSVQVAPANPTPHPPSGDHRSGEVKL